ncbi:hypothetical protein V1477_014755 [Vespula maculifrons]|uniref:Uncharacterized protein n=1 Tax=Vespula maculifrons TaxID=7453 RepID=A0ABD2BIE2_VESMC
MNRLENILCSYRIAKEYESTTSRNAEQGRQYILLSTHRMEDASLLGELARTNIEEKSKGEAGREGAESARKGERKPKEISSSSFFSHRFIDCIISTKRISIRSNCQVMRSGNWYCIYYVSTQLIYFCKHISIAIISIFKAIHYLSPIVMRLQRQYGQYTNYKPPLCAYSIDTFEKRELGCFLVGILKKTGSINIKVSRMFVFVDIKCSLRYGGQNLTVLKYYIEIIFCTMFCISYMVVYYSVIVYRQMCGKIFPACINVFPLYISTRVRIATSSDKS